MKKSLCLIILAAMIIHSAGRFGALSWLYEKRHDIAYAFGLIAEIPIAICNSDYNFDKGLKMESSPDQQAMPVYMQAHEINLFYVSEVRLGDPQQILLSVDQGSAAAANDYLVLLAPVFHPPLV